MQLGCGVGLGSNGDVDHVAQQADFDGTVHAGDAQSCVVRQEWLGRVVVNAIGRVQHLSVGIDQDLDLGHSIHLCAAHTCGVEGAVDGRDVGRSHAQHTGIARACGLAVVGEVGLALSGVVVFGRLHDGGQLGEADRRLRKLGLGHHRLQLAQAVGA